MGTKAIAEETVMPAFDPVTLNIIDEAGAVLFSQSVPLTVGMTARQVLEQAFMIAQTSAKPDPLIFTLAFYGYSEAQQLPGYPGYEIESFNGKSNDSQPYWDLLIDGATSKSGCRQRSSEPGRDRDLAIHARSGPRQIAKHARRVLHGRRAARP